MIFRNPTNLLYALVSLPVFFAMASCTDGGEVVEIEVGVDEGMSLVFRLRNRTESSIRLPASDLPWSDLYPKPLRVAVHAIGNHGKVEIIEEVLLMGSGGYTEVDWLAGQSLEDSIPLERWFPELGTVQWAESYYLHWTYSLDLCDINVAYVNIGSARRTGDRLAVLSQSTTSRPVAESCSRTSIKPLM